MKTLRRCFCYLMIFLFVPRCVVAGPVKTRASQLGPLATGMGAIMHMETFLEDYPGSRTAILYYLKMDSVGAEGVASNLRVHAALQEKKGRAFWPQIALETSTLSLAAFHRELLRSDSPLSINIRTLARAIAEYRSKNKWFFIRPFSEMNDGTDENPWEFGNKAYNNTPQDLAAAWKLLRDTFDQEGATNAIFVFSPLAAYRVHRESQVLAALNLIPPGYIDAFGVNVYARPMTAYGGSSSEPLSFATLAEPWLAVLARSPHRGIPLAVPEMGVSSQASDSQRAAWLRSAFKFVRSHSFVMVTYFNYPYPMWAVDDQTLAGNVLRAELGGGPRIASAGGLAVAKGAEAEIARAWQLLPGNDGPAPPANAKTWKALALVYSQREESAGTGGTAPPIVLEMPRDQVASTVQALRNWPTYIGNATENRVNVALTIAMSRRPLRVETAADGHIVPPRPADVERDLKQLRTLGHFDSVLTVWYSGAGASGSSVAVGGSGGTWAEMALGGTSTRDLGAGSPDRSNLFVGRWLQGVIAYARSLGYSCPAFEDAERYGYGKDPERWIRELMHGTVHTDGGQEGLNAAFWRAGPPTHLRAALPVQLLSPPNNSVWEQLPELTWSATAAEKYRVEIADPRDVEHPVHTAETTQTHYAVPAGVLPLGQLYTWRVVALHGKDVAEDGDRFNFVLDRIPPPELTQASIGVDSLSWIGGPVPVHVCAQSRNILKEVRAILEMPDGGRRQTALQPGTGAGAVPRWDGVCVVPANRTDRLQEARILFEAVDATGHRATTSAYALRIAPRNPQIGPRLEVADTGSAEQPLHGTIVIRAVRDPVVRASGIVYQLQIDDQVISTFRRAPFVYPWNSAEVSEGEHRVRLLLRDSITGASVVSDEIVVTTGKQAGGSP